MWVDLLPLVDVLRIVLTAVGSFCAAYQVVLIRRASGPGERALFAGIAITLAGLVLDRMLHLGQPPSWQVLLTAAVVGLFAHGTYQLHRASSPSRRSRHE